MSIIQLRCGDIYLTLAPQIGGSIAEFFQVTEGERRDFLRPASRRALQTKDVLAMASFPLLPYCNRIRGGQFLFQKNAIKLTANLPPSCHSIHGIGWQLPWTPILQAGDSTILQLDYQHKSHLQRFAWPWDFCAEQEFRLSEEGLQVLMRLRNRSHKPMPFGIGHHPYFLKTACTRLQAHLELMWKSDIDVLPTELVRASVITELKNGVLLEPLDLDNNFVGWHGIARIDDSVHKSLILEADAALNFLTLYVPKDSNYFCVEPVSHCTDAFNLQALGLPLELHRNRVLWPDELFETSWSLSI